MNVTGSFTSLGESTNPSLSTMNPSKVQSVAVESNSMSNALYPKPFESFWSAGDESFVVTDDVPSPNLNNEDPGVNLDNTSITQVEKTSDPSYDSPIVQLVEINTIPKSYAGFARESTKDQPNVKSNFRSLVTDKVFDGVNIYILRKVVEKEKYGLKRIMMNAKGFFFFKFDSWAGLDDVLEGGPWMIRNSPIILKKWSMNTSLQKEELTRILIWVKLHDVPIQVFRKMVYLILMVLVIPRSIRVEYEWKPPRCPTCNIFGHAGESCPKKVVTNPVVNDTNANNDGFQKVVNRKRHNKGSLTGNKLPKGVPRMMMRKKSVASWNIRGLNRSPKQKEVRQVVNENNLSVYAILESHVDVAVVYDTCKKVCSRWKWTSNGNLCSKGSRIILGWNDDLVDVMIMAQTNQVMHVQVNTRIDNKTLFCSFIYADNYYFDRRALWSNLVGHARLMQNRPWVLLGDFNAPLNLEDHSSGGYEPNATMRKFKECPSYGDRIMGNLQFNGDFPGSFAIFQPYRISDHSPCVLRILTITKPKPKPFKFSNFLVYKEGFREIVETGWSVNFEDFAMFRVVKRLKGLKSPFCKLLHNHGNLHKQVNKICVELDEAQKAIDRDHSSYILREEHAHYLLAFKEAQLDEERFLNQKAKVKRLKAGDSNTTYFHKIVKSKCARNRIEMVSNASNIFYDGNQVPDAFVNHYNQFIGAEGVTNPLDDHDLFIRVLFFG
ncbi:RNA-directed DNA polymerase, eukaryota, reverse transcriptase zinc-binding domain protein [Tanacetum coccineum]